MSQGKIVHSNENLFVSVVIPTYRDWPRLQKCLTALIHQNYPRTAFEIIIVNNDSKTVPPGNFNFPENAKLLTEEKPGSYAARNSGLQRAQGEIIGFTDSDCIPDANWIRNAAKQFDSHDGAERVTGPVNIFRTPNSSWLAWKFESITAFNQKYNVKNGVSVTANLFVKKSVFTSVGVFDASLFSGGDVEWNKRATVAGAGLILAEDVIVNHPARASMRDLFDKTRRVLGGAYVQAKKNKNLLSFTLRYFCPPIVYAEVLIQDGKSLADILFATFIYWCFKILMLLEILRLRFGGRPLR